MSETVEELLLDMKDTSELMVDLAYSAVFYGSKSIASEVVALEEDVGGDFMRLQRLVLAAVRANELSDDHALVLIRVAQMTESIANSALEIADVVLRDVDLHPVMVQSIVESESTITKVTIHETSPWANHTLRDLELESETGMRVLAAKRHGRWLSGVEGDFCLQSGDLLIAMGPLAAEEGFVEIADPTWDGDESR